EFAHVADGLHVQDDAARGRVVAEVVDQVGEIDVDHGADADEAAEADVLLAGPVEDRGADGAALAEQGDVAGPGHGGGEAGVKIARRVEHAQAGRAEDAQPAAGQLAELPLPRAALGAQLREARGDDDGRLHPAVDAVLDGGGHGGRGRGDDGQVHDLGDVGQVGVAVDAVDGAAPGVDRVDDSAERVF